MAVGDIRIQGQLATSAGSLQALAREARERPDRALSGAAKQFEAIFMQMLLKSMRDAVPQSGLLGSNETSMYTSMLDQELTQRLGTKGLGLAEIIIKQLGAKIAPQSGSVEAPTVPQVPTAPQKPEGQAAEPTAGSASGTLTRPSQTTPTASAAGSTAQAFVDSMLPHATAAAQATGVPAAFILGQAALETGWGKGQIVGRDGTQSYNLFGIKAGKGWTGATVEVVTTEYIDGTPRKLVDKFRAYSSYAESFRDYAQLLSNSPRYAAALRQGQTASGFASSLQRGGYATDPAYADKLTRVINHTLSLARIS